MDPKQTTPTPPTNNTHNAGLGDIFGNEASHTSVPTPQVQQAQPTPTPQVQQAQPTSTPQVQQAQPTPTSQVQQSQPTSTPQVQQAQAMPTPVVQQSQPTPTPQIQQSQATPTPQVQQAQPTPTPQVQQAQATPTPQVQQTQPTPTPQVQQTQPTPTPQVQQSQATPTPVVQQSQPTPTPQIQQSQATPTPQVQQTQPTPTPQVQQSQATPTPVVQQSQATTTPQIQNTQATPISQVQTPTANQVITKKGTKVSPLKFALGCGIFGFILIGAIGFLLFFALQNPSQFQGIIGIDGIKTGLKLFAGLFFGLLFLGSFILIIFNLYKMITTKIGSKVGYTIGLIFGLFLLGGTVFGGIVSFNKINEMIATTGATDILTPYIKFKDESKPTTQGFPVIAPTKVTYAVNDILLTRFLTTNFVNKTINSLQLDCGNGKQFLNYDWGKKQFMGQCLYLKKGDYPIKVITSIKDKATGVTEDIVSNWKDFRVISEIALAPSSGTLTHNDAYDEIIIGQAPTKVHFDSTMVFTDMKLPEYKVKRDLDGDGTFDKSDITIFSHQFREPKIQSIYYTLPSVNNLVYQIDLRVLQNEVPICTITTEQSKTSGTKYHITTSFDNKQTRINSYMYRIKDLHTNKFVATIPNKRESFDYDFTSKGDYVIYLDYVTEDNKRGQCESDTMTVGASSFDVNYTLKYQGPHDTSRQALEATGTVSKQNNGILINALPAKLLLDINHITPQTPTTNLTVKLDNQIIQSPNGKAFEIPLYNNTHRILTISVYDSSTQSTSLIELPLHITQETILGKLTAFPNTVGNSPFEVTLDASTTTLTDKDDEIIYFTWDYGDGEIIKNSSQARTSHTYSYNEELDKGSYNPQVTVTTKKGKSASFGLAQPILVTKPSVEANISIDSHPAQIASVGDKVIFSLNTDGTPSQIIWDFGNNEKIECTDRSCTNNVPMFFTDPGTYTVNATITYKNLNTTNATTTIVIQQ